MDSSESKCGDMVNWQRQRMSAASVILFWSSLVVLLHLVQRSSFRLSQVSLCLRVLTPVVVVTEECKNTDNQTHHHKQCQGGPEKSPIPGNLGTKPAKKNQDLLHPPVKIMASYSITKSMIFS